MIGKGLNSNQEQYNQHGSLNNRALTTSVGREAVCEDVDQAWGSEVSNQLCKPGNTVTASQA